VTGALWDLCVRIADDPDGLGAGTYDAEIEQIAVESDTLSTCFAEPEPPYGLVSFMLPGGRVAFSATVLPSRGWNPVAFEIRAPAATDLLGNLYPLPANVYIRNAQWGDAPARIRAINDTVEGSEGPARQFALGFSSPQVLLRTPVEPGPYRLRMEVYIELNIFTGFDALLRQTRKTRALETELSAATDNLCKLEQQSLKLRQEIERLKGGRS
jgi:hypothetical protein